MSRRRGSLMDQSSLPRPIGFVLGGGGSLGALQVGMLQALAEQSITPDLVAGTSVGSINGAVVAMDPRSAANRLSHIWVRLTREDAFPGGLLSQARLLRQTRTHLFPNSGLAAIIGEHLAQTKTFEELTLPFAAVAMDVSTAAAVVLGSGPLLPALLASAAIPGVYPPVHLGGLVLYDGGIVANVPMRQAQDLGARSLVVLDCSFAGQMPAMPSSIEEILFYTFMVSMRNQAVLEAPIVAGGMPVVYLPGPPMMRVSPLDFSHTEELIEGAYDSSGQFLRDLVISGPGLYGTPSGASQSDTAPR